MVEQKKQAISRRGLDATFVEAESKKSNLILKANLLKAQGQYQEAADCFAEAAQIEERLSEILMQQNLGKYFIHRFSALSCWAQAGNVYQAIVMGEELLTNPKLPKRLRQRVQEYIKLVRSRRECWFTQFVPEMTTVAPSS